MDTGLTFDVEGLAQSWLRSFPGLVGKGCPLIGIHLSDDVRSPQTGALATLRVTGTRTVDMEGLGDSARISFDVLATGREGGAKKQAERGARALAAALRTLTGVPHLVERDGVTAKLTFAHTVNGPIFAGVQRGQSTYRVDATMVWQQPD